MAKKPIKRRNAKKSTPSKSAKIKRQRTKKVELVRIKGSARRYKDINTGVEYSRHAATKILKKQGKIKPRIQSYKSVSKFKMYLGLRDDYIAKKLQEGKSISVRQAMQSDELKNIVKDLQKGYRLKQQGKISEGNKMMLKALKKTTRRNGIPDSIPVGESPKGLTGA